jgi:uncharacterized membrane protein YcaP (DUF421 family)
MWLPVMLAGLVSSDVMIPGVSLLEKILRPILVYSFLVVLLRIFGKRELAQLNPFDLVVLLSLSNTVQNAIIGADLSVTGGLVGAFSLCAINYLVVRFLFKHRRLDQLIEGKPTVLIEDGRLRHDGLAAELLTEPELLSVMHRQGFATIDEIERCVLEPNGTFFIESKEPRLVERHHIELIERLERLERLLEARLGAVTGADPLSPTGDGTAERPSRSSSGINIEGT